MLRSEGTPAPSVLKDDGYASAGFIVSSSFKGDNKKRRRALGEKQRNGEKHKEGSFEQAPGLSRGRGRAVPTTLPSVKQTDGERERGWGEDGRDGERGAIQHIDLMSIFSLCLRSVAERTMRTYTLSAPQGLILGRLSQVFSH